ncbi:MAG: glycerol-3-phosphate acyltransferase [Anaerosomatales bacterium]|nr:glycerol-3-phosphate acyltransferase [Anaerosomatales bacterium]MDT8434150.1 glycerol-3-phosphate acyltransferase [Anaerosomatales bacterium]
MEPQIAVLAAATGYLLGAISFARVVVRLKTGGDVETARLTTPDGGGHLTVTAVSASAVRLQLGPRYGILVGALDILKAFLPTLGFLLLYPGQPYYLICAAAAPFGHNWPIYHRFRGGNGQAVILGGMLAIDWAGAVVTNGAATLLGLTVLSDGLIGDIGGIPLLLPWMWWRYGISSPEMLYAAAVNVAWWVSFRPSLQQYLALKRNGNLPTAEHAVAMFRMDFGFMRRLSPRRYEEIDELRAHDSGTKDPEDKG